MLMRAAVSTAAYNTSAKKAVHAKDFSNESGRNKTLEMDSFSQMADNLSFEGTVFL